MKKFEVKFLVGSKGYKQTVEAENEAVAKQKILSEIKFISVDEIKPSSNQTFDDFGGIMNQFGDIFGEKSKK